MRGTQRQSAALPPRRRSGRAGGLRRLTEYIGCVKSQSLIADIDENPCKLKTDLKVLLVGGLTTAATAIG